MVPDGWARHTPTLSGTKVIRALSIDSALLPSMGDAITQLTYDRNWLAVGDQVVDIVSECKDALDSWYTPMVIGQISYFLGALPSGWLPLDGTTYNNSDYPELAGILDAQFVSGTQFTLPDIQDLFLLSAGQINDLGETGGESDHILTVDEIPGHSHSYTPPVENVDLEAPGAPDILAAGLGAPTQTGTTGSGDSHNNMPPFFVARAGIFGGRVA